MASTKMGSDPNHFLYSVILTCFALLYLCLDIVQAQNIVPFPASTPVTSPDSIIIDEFKYDLTMSGATTTKVSESHHDHISLIWPIGKRKKSAIYLIKKHKYLNVRICRNGLFSCFVFLHFLFRNFFLKGGV